MARYMRSDLGRGHSRLSPPAVVGAGIAWHGPGVYLTAISQGESRIRRRGTSYALRPPQVVTAAVVQIFFGPQVTYRVAVQTPQSTALARRSPISRLSSPSITGSTGPSLYSLAASRRGQAKSFLRPPADTIGLEDQGKVFVSLSPSRRGSPKSRLSPPAVVGAVVETGVFYGPQITLAPSPKPKVRSTWVYPIVISRAQAWGYTAIQYVRRPRPKTTYKLFPPVVSQAVVQVYYGPEVTLARARRPVAKSVLRPPAILASNLPTAVTLAASSRGKARYRLSPPTVVYLAVEIYGPEVTLAPQRRGQPKSFLRLPAILASNLPTVTTFAPQRRGVPRYRLAPPTVVFLAVEIYGPTVQLTRIRPRPVTTLLQPPTVVTAAESFYGPEVHLTRITPQPTTTALRPPIDVLDAHELALGPEVHLTRIKPVPTTALVRPPADITEAHEFPVLRLHLSYSRRGVPKSRLLPPAVVGQIVYFGPQVTLAPSSRGLPKSRLYAPTAVEQPPAFLPAEIVWLTPSRRPVTKSLLRPPAVVGAGKVNPALRRYLVARKSRLVVHKTVSFLRPPIIPPQIFFGPVLTLTPSRRGQPKSFLQPPVVVRVVAFAGPQITLTYSKRGRPQYHLQPPAVVGRAPFRGLLLHLTYSRRGKPISFRQPVVEGIAPHRGIQVHLTRITQPPVLTLLKPPSVVGAGVAFYGPEITLVRIRPPKVMHFLRLTLVAFRRPQGDVCGFDIAGSFVCSLEVPGALVSGSDSAGQSVSGTSQAGSTVTGSDSAGGSVSGSDRKAT